MREFIELLNRAVGQARFEMRNRGTYTALELRNIYRREPMLFALANTQLQEELAEEATTLLRSMLHKHIIDDRVGNGLAFFLRGISPLSVSDLALHAVRASVVLGPERVVELLTKWESGQPIPFTSYVILSGVSVEQPLEIVRGVHLETTPKSSDQILAQLPRQMHWHLGG